MEVKTTIAIRMNDVFKPTFVSRMDYRLKSDTTYDYRKTPGSRGGPRFVELVGQAHAHKV